MISIRNHSKLDGNLELLEVENIKMSLISFKLDRTFSFANIPCRQKKSQLCLDLLYKKKDTIHLWWLPEARGHGVSTRLGRQEYKEGIVYIVQAFIINFRAVHSHVASKLVDYTHIEHLCFLTFTQR